MSAVEDGRRLTLRSGEFAGALRILNLFAQRGLAPRSIALSLVGEGYDLSIDAGDIDDATVAIIRSKIAAMPIDCAFAIG
ncbi:MAG: hypothetical protein JNL35_06715 [Sphingopyxis sp.]|nr:hypothetical protein [Sphingopyxis sp.]